jgi:para-nitrobenzyl esterase
MGLDPSMIGAESESKEDENCLVVNIWTPKLGDGKKRPVMFWMHGGGYAFGSGTEAMNNGARLSKRGDIVVVTVTHRRNAFGYLHLGDIFGAEYESSGMAGMMDIVLALEWVRDNIEKFGGDPANVTIFGESGGGTKVSTTLAIPAAKGLFSRAIVQSGPGLRGMSRDTANLLTEEFLAALGIQKGELEKLQETPPKRIIEAQKKIFAESAGHMIIKRMPIRKVSCRNGCQVSAVASVMSRLRLLLRPVFR